MTHPAKQARTVNIIDILRFVGCFCIVWYHSGYFWTLPDGDRQWVLSVELLAISWAMPFFYIVTAYFSLGTAKSLHKTINRVVNIGLLLALYSFFYYLFYHHFKFGGLAHLDVILKTFIEGASTPCYFLWHVMVIQLIVCLINRFSLYVPMGKTGYLFDTALVVLAFCSVAPLCDGVFGILHINAFCVAAPCLAYVAEKHKNTGTLKLPACGAMGIAFLLMLAIGLYSLYANDAGWGRVTPLVTILIALGFLFIYQTSKNLFVDGAHPIAAWLAHAGQVFSLGVFLIHQFALSFFDPPIIHLLAGWNVGFIAIYITINLMGFAIALGLTMLLSKYCPALVTISRRDWFGQRKAA